MIINNIHYINVQKILTSFHCALPLVPGQKKIVSTKFQIWQKFEQPNFMERYTFFVQHDLYESA